MISTENARIEFVVVSGGAGLKLPAYAVADGVSRDVTMVAEAIARKNRREVFSVAPEGGNNLGQNHRITVVDRNHTPYDVVIRMPA